MVKFVFSYPKNDKNGKPNLSINSAVMKAIEHTGPFPFQMVFEDEFAVVTIWGPRSIKTQELLEKNSGLDIKILEKPVLQPDLPPEERGYGMSTDIFLAPSYLKGHVAEPKKNGPSSRLAEGNWCGHGEPLFRVYDIIDGNKDTFSFSLPYQNESGKLSPVAVKVSSSFWHKPFLVYDTRKHPASLYADKKYADREPLFQSGLFCPECWGRKFYLSVGFAAPMDTNEPDDISWFALAAKCKKCGFKSIPYSDETA